MSHLDTQSDTHLKAEVLSGWAFDQIGRQGQVELIRHEGPAARRCAALKGYSVGLESDAKRHPKVIKVAVFC